MTLDDADEERRFGGLRRLYGSTGYDRLRRLHVAVVGVGGVGSWCAEALARSGVARLSLVDLDHVAESNINRQVQAGTDTLGAAKVEALGARIRGIHPACRLDLIEEFVGADTWPLQGAADADVVIDACDDPRAKLVLASWALSQPTRHLVIAGAAGGKRHPQRVEVADLAAVTHDPLLSGLRQRLRKAGLIAAVRAGDKAKPAQLRTGLTCVFSRETVAPPAVDDAACATDGSLNCHGYGSTVTVTAAFGLAAASVAVEWAVAGLANPAK